MALPRPVLISTMQYDAALREGTLNPIDVIDVAKRLGTSGVEFREVYWKNKEREIPAVRDRMSELGLEATYTTFTTLFNAQGDATVLHTDMDDTVALGAPLLRIFPGDVPGADDEQAWEAAAKLVKYAAARGIVLALENFMKAPGCTLEEITTVLNRIDSPTLRCNVDIGNYTVNGQDVAEAIQTLGERIIYAHLKDPANTPNGHDATYLGGGTLPLRDILAAFDRLPQAITYCFEFNGGGDPEGRIQKSLEYLKQG